MRLAFLLAALLAGACASGAPAPISYGRAAPSAEAQTPAQTPTPRTREPTGEAQRAPPVQAPERAAQRAPDWADGPSLSDYALQPEQAHPFDPARTPPSHTVRRGETLYDIATTYQTPLRALIDQNNLEPPYAIAEGAVLRLPPPRLHTVARGETLESIARRYSIDLRSLALLNRMQPPYVVRAGEQIVLPAMARAAAPEPSPAAQPAPAGGPWRFGWPVEGRIVTAFGPLPGGGQSDGVEIAATVGASVKAAADGQVVFAGESVPNHGVIVLIAHADNYVTAYALNRRALVREGQAVRAGETIAELGQRTGAPAKLMFQVRRSGAPVDPAPLLQRRP